MGDTGENKLKFDREGLIPVVIQDIDSGTVLMVAYMNRESYRKTVETGETHFWSRSRSTLWHKGETSGNTQSVKRIDLDCDGDTLLVQVEQKGNACHTGAYSCFFENLRPAGEADAGLGEVLGSLARVIRQRKAELPEGSYTTKLFQGGTDKILKKIGEEAGEVIIAAKNHDKKEISWEAADLLYHLLVLLESEDVRLNDVAAELQRRAAGKSGK